MPKEQQLCCRFIAVISDHTSGNVATDTAQCVVAAQGTSTPSYTSGSDSNLQSSESLRLREKSLLCFSRSQRIHCHPQANGSLFH